MAGAGRDTIEELMKELYIPPVIRQINEEILLLKRLEARKQEIIQGRYAVVPMSFGRTAGIGPARERGALPEAGKQTFKRATFNIKYLYGRGEVTGPSMATTKSDAGSFLNVLKAEVDGLRRDLTNDLSWQVYGDGSGSIAGVASVAAQVITLDSTEALKKGQIYLDMVLDIIQPGSPPTAQSSDLVVTDYDVTAGTVTVTGTVNAVSGDEFLARANSVDADGFAGVTGIDKIISTDSFGGLDPADPGLEQWGSYVDSGGGAFAIDDLHTAWNEIRIRSGDFPKSVITSFGLTRAYFNELQAQVQYVEPMKIEGGFKVLEFMGVPLFGDPQAPYGKIFLPDESQIKVFATGDFAPLDEDGHFLHWVTGFDMWEWALARYMELGAFRRNSSGKLTGLTDTGV